MIRRLVLGGGSERGASPRAIGFVRWVIRDEGGDALSAVFGSSLDAAAVWANGEGPRAFSTDSARPVFAGLNLCSSTRTDRTIDSVDSAQGGRPGLATSDGVGADIIGFFSDKLNDGSPAFASALTDCGLGSV
jgi:hypothetical protein